MLAACTSALDSPPAVLPAACTAAAGAAAPPPMLLSARSDACCCAALPPVEPGVLSSWVQGVCSSQQMRTGSPEAVGTVTRGILRGGAGCSAASASGPCSSTVLMDLETRLRTLDTSSVMPADANLRSIPNVHARLCF